MDIKEEIRNQLYTKNGNINTAVIRQPWFLQSPLHQNIIVATSFLSPEVSLSERIWCILNNIFEIQYCKVCLSAPVTFCQSRGKGYYSVCSNKKCTAVARQPPSESYAIIRQRSNQHIITGFQTQYKSFVPTQTYEQIKEQTLQYTSNERWCTLDEEKINYILHVIHYTNNLLPFSIDNYTGTRCIDIPERQFILRHAIASLPTCKLCLTSVTFQNGKVGYSLYCNKCRNLEATEQSKIKVSIRAKERLTQHGFEIIQYDYLTSDIPIILKCKQQHLFSPTLHSGRWMKYINCPVCHPSSTSSGEQEVFEWLNSIIPCENRRPIHNTTRKEIDIFVPSRNLGIEYNGVYWHSYNTIETTEERRRHIIKTNLCKEYGIELIHINEIDWITKKPIIKSRILNKLGMTTNKIYARKCIIKQLTTTEQREFFDETHTQGYVNSKICYGLLYNNEIVAAMSFGINRFTTNKEWELLRFSNQLETNVIGGANKLLSHFINNYVPTVITSYCDRNWSTGNLYSILGFEFDSNTSPNYSYTKHNKLYNRIRFQKHKLSKILETFNPTLSEAENMFANGYRRLWDCGNTKWVLNCRKPNL